MKLLPVSLLLIFVLNSVTAFILPKSSNNVANQSTSLNMADTAASSSTRLFDPKERDAHYQNNVARYLLDLHDTKSTFDFCGGMMFQLVLTDALRAHLQQTTEQPVIHDASQPRMAMIPNYSRTAQADNVHIFHGREIRQVPDAAGGMGMVLQLSLAGQPDPEGWTPQEQDRYDGWGHDSGREWRKGLQLEQEGFTNFREKFGPAAFSLHHRFYLHYDGSNRMWLSAEDGCEGTPAAAPVKRMSNLFGLLQ
jgi:hypothetical protein